MSTDTHPTGGGYSGSWADWIGESISGSERSARRRRAEAAAEYNDDGYEYEYDTATAGYDRSAAEGEIGTAGYGRHAAHDDEDLDGYGRTRDEYDIPPDMNHHGRTAYSGRDDYGDYDEYDEEEVPSVRAELDDVAEPGYDEDENAFYAGTSGPAADIDFEESGSHSDDENSAPGTDELNASAGDLGSAPSASDHTVDRPGSRARGPSPSAGGDSPSASGINPGASESSAHRSKPDSSASNARGSGTSMAGPPPRERESGSGSGGTVADTGSGGRLERVGQPAGTPHRARRVRPHPFPSSDPHWIPEAASPSALPHPYSSAAARTQAPVDPRTRAAAADARGTSAARAQSSAEYVRGTSDDRARSSDEPPWRARSGPRARSSVEVEYYDDLDSDERSVEERPRGEFEHHGRMSSTSRPGSSAAARLHRAPATTRRSGSSWEGWALREWLADSKERWAVPLLAILGICAIGAAVTVQLTKSDGATPQAAAPVTTTQAQSSPEPAAPAVATGGDCPAETSGSHVRGSGPGGYKSGPDAILALQHAYYVARSGALVRSLVDVDAAIPSAAEIQAGIDTIPMGTTHCVQISPGAFSGQYIVIVTEFRPDQSRRIWSPQLVMTNVIGDRTVITAIVPLADDATPR